MTDKSIPDFSRLTRHMDRMSKAKKVMVQNSIASDDKNFEVALAVTDELWDSLVVLCNYSHAVDHNGKSHDSTDVTTELKESIRDSFQRITGREYQPPNARILQATQKEV